MGRIGGMGRIARGFSPSSLSSPSGPSCLSSPSCPEMLHKFSKLVAGCTVLLILGGVTVLFFLPAAVSTAHAGLAQIFFCMTVAIALFTGPGWKAGYGDSADPATGIDDQTLRRLATTTTGVIYAQVLIGATMRH